MEPAAAITIGTRRTVSVSGRDYDATVAADADTPGGRHQTAYTVAGPDDYIARITLCHGPGLANPDARNHDARLRRDIEGAE